VGVTIVIVSHELSVVELLCRHVAVMEQGRLVEQFAVDETGAPRQTALGRELDELVRRRPERAAARRLCTWFRNRSWPMPENIAAILPELWLATGQTF
jgi:ABC-type methionine transport system ATPase subunit